MDGGCDQKGLNAHVHQAGDGLRRAVGVQSAEHKVSGEGGLDGDFGGFKIADFADENDVGILAEEGAQGGGKVEADLLLHLNLVDALQLEFDRIFGGHDVGVRLVEQGDGRVQGVGFARAGRAGDEHHSVRS